LIVMKLRAYFIEEIPCIGIHVHMLAVFVNDSY